MANRDYSQIDLNSIESNKKSPIRDYNSIDVYNIEPQSTLLPDNTIDLGNNFDGSKKFSFDTIYQDSELINTAKEFYEERDNIEFDTTQEGWEKDVIDEYINDRTWKQANISSAFKELYQVENMNANQMKRLSYLTEYWNNLPNFWEDGGRSASSAIYQNLKAGLLDWTNLASGGVGALITKTAGKQFVKELGKQSLKKQIAKTVGTATVATSAFDAGVFAAGDLAIQKAEKELNLRKDYDLGRTATTAIVGAGISILPNGLANYGAVRLTADMITVPKETSRLPSKLQSVIKELDAETGKVTEVIQDFAQLDLSTRSGKVKRKLFINEGDKKGLRWGASFLKQKMFDKDNFFKLFQYAYTGVAGSSKALPKAVELQEPATKEVIKLIKEGKDDKIPLKYLDPSQLTYFKIKETSAHTLRADNFLEEGVSILRNTIGDDGKIKAEYVPTGNRGLMQIIKDFDDVGEGEMFLHYVLAKRSQGIIEQNAKLLKKNPKAKIQDTPFHPKGKMSNQKRQEIAKEKSQELVDYGEKLASQVGRNENAPSFTKGLDEWRAFYDDMLEYAKSKGLHSTDDLAKMKAANPYGYIPMRTVSKTIIETFDKGTEKVVKGIEGVGTSRKKKKLIGDGRKIEQSEVAPLLKSSIDYVYHMTKAADINDRKLSFYRLLDNLDESEAGFIAKQASTVDKESVELLTKQTLKKMEDMGIVIDKSASKELAELDDKFTTMGFTSSYKNTDGKVLDIVYRNVLDEKTGKIKNKKFVYEIKSALLQDSLYTLPTEYGPFLTKVFSSFRYLSRLPARAITYSPPFVAFNFIRDSLSATINSSFGFFNPLMSFKGFGMTFAGNTNGKNVEKLINAVRRNDEFRKALISGLGLSTRKDVERFAGINNIDSYGKSQATGWYKKNLNYLSQNVFGRGARGYAELVSRIEYASRYAEYLTAKKHGLSSTAAAITGREVSTDFAMRGSSAFLNRYASVTMFFNAGLQGFYRGMRVFLEGDNVKRIKRRREGKDISKGAIFDALSDVNTRAVIAVGGTIVAPELLLHMRNRDLPEYQDVPDEVKQLNYLIPWYEDETEDGSHLHPDGTRKVKFFTAIPKPYDFGVFANIATGIYEGIMKKSPGIALDYVVNSFSKIMPGFAAPTLANPWFAIFMNKNWLGDEILPHGYQRLPGELQRKSNTRRSAILMSQYIQKITGKAKSKVASTGENVYDGMTVSPIILDYIMSGYLTGIASYPLDLVDAMLWDDNKLGEKPVTRGDKEDLARQPWSIVTRRFQVQTPIKNSKSLQKFYNIRNKARKLKAGVDYTLNDLESILDLKYIDKLSITEIRENVGISPFLEMVSTELSEIRGRINRIEKKKNYKGFEDVPASQYEGMSESQIKRKDMDFLLQVQNDIANMVLKTLQESNFETIQKDVFGYTEYEEKPKEGGFNINNLNSKFFN